MEIKVELRPHAGKRKTPLGEFPIDFDQDMIFVSTTDAPEFRHVGFVGRKPNAPINLIVNWGDDVRKVLHEAIVKHLRDRDSSRKVFSPAIPPLEEEGEEEFEEDES